ncbi:MAG: biotin/lipoate A/B protein ligase family protein, partial [Pirellulales bacterium]
MQRLLLTLGTPAENIALDEALLDEADASGPDAEYLRIWESPTPLVVLGRSSRAADEVDLDACRTRGTEVLRRASGGAAIVAGPGCLMYAVVLSYERRPEARGIHPSHDYVLERIASALRKHASTVAKAGTSDLVLLPEDSQKLPRKFSGNSLRVKRTHFLYHGTLLYDFDLALIAACLRTAPRQPEYRQERDHANFVTNLPLAKSTLITALDTAWPTTGELSAWPKSRVSEVVRERYQSDDW